MQALSTLKGWLRDHSLSVVLGVVVASMLLTSLWAEHRVWIAEDLPVGYRTWWVAHISIELFGSFAEVLFLVIATKKLRERGSAESN